jgi:acyl-coenzyme A thioesterase PaaI-like protein
MNNSGGLKFLYNGSSSDVLTTANTTLSYGTYTPTGTSVTNVSSTTGNANCHYTRQGSQVTVYGTADITVTAGSTITVFAVSLPVASNFTATADCTGTAAGNTNPTVGIVTGSVANDRAEITFAPPSSGSQTVTFSFTYTVQ